MSLEQAIEKLTAAVEANTVLLRVIFPTPVKIPAISNADASNPNAVTATTPTEKKGPGRPKKEAAAPVVVVPEPVIEVVEPTEAANDDDFLDDEPTPATKLTKDDVRSALVTLQRKKGSPEASRAILKQFKADTLGTLKESDYSAVIEAAKKAA